MSFTIRLVSIAMALVAASHLFPGVSVTEPAVASAQGGDSQQAIMQVVEAFNYGMMDATAQRDPTVVRPYLTDEFYQEIMLQLRADWSQGVAAVSLIELEWGTVTIRGNEAIAYTVETWAIRLVDGSGGEFPPEINLYRLILQDDGWKVDANDHPGSMF
jgi:hypothetical protein